MRTTKAQISLRIRAFWSAPLLFPDWIVWYLYFLCPKFQATTYLLWLRRPVCVLPGRKPQRQVFSWRGSNTNVPYIILYIYLNKIRFKLNWAATWQNQQSGCAPSQDSDQPGHPPSLIRVFAVRMKKAWVLSYPLSAQRRLIRLGGCQGWSESSLGAQPHCWFCHDAAHYWLPNLSASKRCVDVRKVNTAIW